MGADLILYILLPSYYLSARFGLDIQKTVHFERKHASFQIWWKDFGRVFHNERYVNIDHIPTIIRLIEDTPFLAQLLKPVKKFEAKLRVRLVLGTFPETITIN